MQSFTIYYMEMFGFLDKRRKRKLYQEWVDKSKLPGQEIPKDIQQVEPNKEEAIMENSQQRNIPDGDGAYLRIRLRYVVLGCLIFSLLLVVIAVLATMLFIQF